MENKSRQKNLSVTFSKYKEFFVFSVFNYLKEKHLKIRTGQKCWNLKVSSNKFSLVKKIQKFQKHVKNDKRLKGMVVPTFSAVVSS